jgi:hypothetical protein
MLTLLSASLLSKNIKVKKYGTIIFRVVLCGCETWSLTLREEHMLKVFDNRVLRRILGLRGGEITGKWRRIHNQEFYGPYSPQNIIRVVKPRRMRWVGHVAYTGGRGEVHTGFWWGNLRER